MSRLTTHQRMGYYCKLGDGKELHSSGLTLLNVKGDISICSPGLTFKCLSDQNIINIFSVKNWFEFVRALFKPFQFIKR